MALATKPRAKDRERLTIPDTKRCPECSRWFLQDDATSRLLSSYDTHILQEHPDLVKKQEAFLRGLYRVPVEVELSEFFREPEEEERKKQRMAATATKKEQAEKAPAKPAGPCLDLCGLMTKPGRNFLPGHDARLKSRLIKIQNGDPEAGDVPDEVKPHLDELFNGRFSEMGKASWKKPLAQNTKTAKGDKGDKEDAIGKLAQMGKGAGAAARKAATK